MKWKLKTKQKYETCICDSSRWHATCRAIEYWIVLLIECAFETSERKESVSIEAVKWVRVRMANGMNFYKCKWFEQTNWVAPINANWFLLSALKQGSQWSNEAITIWHWSAVPAALQLLDRCTIANSVVDVFKLNAESHSIIAKNDCALFLLFCLCGGTGDTEYICWICDCDEFTHSHIVTQTNHNFVYHCWAIVL